MLTTKLTKILTTVGVIAGIVMGLSAPVLASCRALQVIGGSGTKVSKEVSPPGTLIFVNNNWNTDFAVSSDANFNYFIANMTARNRGEYDVKMYLKYSDNTDDKFVDRTVFLDRDNEKVRLPSQPDVATPRRNEDPYQINIFVGGIEATGNVYDLEVLGCY
ncbi:hypothetical protein Pse7367_2836 [Thalassoporum mexicanum PCC 7367]|uniref:hypothetical protein n=1 Tax=Thalassoporum mexicanum TaxID=3457544 RepID=UPI00029FD690|nr:hypothetical protein [Pseudanabaena sp. PCC 7367]AFY71089.1 hypothetical protein Pse7367_2836 [Pseudanabaena sp. PCC 7367]